MVGIIRRRGLRIKACRRNQPNKSKLLLYISHFIHFNSSLKRLYISNKMERFSSKGGCGGHERASVEALREELAWAIDKWFWVISNIMLFNKQLYH